MRPFFWTATSALFKPNGEHAWLVIGNPTDTTSTAYTESAKSDWQVIQMSALDLPNAKTALKGEPIPLLSAIGFA